ncbi:MAG: replication-relaxation family protein [Pseudobdellovibrionaceae bacterium]|nr:MAG: replication-relaxation family protein [Pseudobdellovibrionaceae bacterium]
MAEVIKKYMRGKQIIQLLKLHGPLSYRALKRMIEPAMTKGKLLRALQRLQKKNYVERRFERVFAGKGVFYNLCQQEDVLKEIAEFTGLGVDELKQPHFRHRELLHSECCALWVHVLMKMFPEAEIVRDFDFQNSKGAEKIMLASAQELYLYPDLLLIFPESKTQKEVAIAVEIERTPKTVRRLRQKLKKYANGTHVDGVIYLCDTQHITNSIFKVYSEKPLQDSKRVGHYSENFLLFGDSLSIHTDRFYELFNSRFKTVFLPDWITYLRDTRLNSRRDSNFKMGVLRSPHEKQLKRI